MKLLLLSLFASVASATYHLDVHLKNNNLGLLTEKLYSISTPGSSEYGQFLSNDDVRALVGADDDSIESVKQWLIQAGGDSVTVNSHNSVVTAAFHLDSPALRLTSRGLPHSDTHPIGCVDFVVRRDPLPRSNAEAVDHATSAVQLATSSSDDGNLEAAPYTVSNIKDAYQMPVDLQASNDATTAMVWGPGTFGYSPAQLRLHRAKEAPLINMDKITFDTDNHGEAGGDNFGEGQLDVTMLSSFGLNVNLIVSNTNTSSSTEETTGFGAALLSFITELSARETVPHILSMSLGSLSAASCDLLCTEAVAEFGHTLEECQAYIATQRQVCMFLSTEQTDKINTALQVLGARGVTVMGSSGDGGSHFSFGPFKSDGGIGDDLNSVSCKYQIPVFPTASPYVLSIGGEMWDNDDSSKPITWAGYGGGSGGGFSIEFDAPEHQKATVAEYLAKDGMPPASSFDATKRAYPDVSAVGVSGTSQSCPLLAGMLSLLVDMRLNAGLPALGFLGPRLYQVATDFPGEAFEDIVGGNSGLSCGDETGFPAGEGWDANTGFGRPLWPGMVKHFASDESLVVKEAAGDDDACAPENVCVYNDVGDSQCCTGGEMCIAGVGCRC
jgi:tripeptidyl-peptidase-1